MRELRPGVWYWQSPHPDWDEAHSWPELVSSYGIELGDEFLLIDPLSVPDELREPATAVVLTAPSNREELLEDLTVLEAAGPLSAGEYQQMAEHGQRVSRHAGSFP